jgi:putative Mg2+ transporter-C (MgtC) family protein
MDRWNTIIHDYLTVWGWTTEALVKLLLAALLGAAIGIERETRGRDAGFRTTLLVCVGCCLAMIVSQKLAAMHWQNRGAYSIVVDPGRIAYGVMTGIGFLGAGTIIRNGPSVKGLTTAAGIWCVAAIGLCVGIEQYVLAAGAALLVLVSLGLLNAVDRYIPALRFRRLTLRCRWDDSVVDRLIDAARAGKLTVKDHGFTRPDAHPADVDVWLIVAYVDAAKYADAERAYRQDPKVTVIASEPA